MNVSELNVLEMNIADVDITQSIINYVRLIGELSPGDVDCKWIDDAVLSIFETDYFIEVLIGLDYDNDKILDYLEYSIILDFKQLELIYERLDIPVLI